MSQLSIYTDGGASPNPGLGGWGVAVVRENKLIAEYYGSEQQTSNNRMELIAAIRGLSAIDENQPVTLHTDSNYVRQGITQWINNWKQNKWKTANKKAVKNQDLWQWLDDLASRRSINWEWVKGHDGNKWNEYVDGLVHTARSEAE